MGDELGSSLSGASNALGTDASLGLYEGSPFSMADYTQGGYPDVVSRAYGASQAGGQTSLLDGWQGGSASSPGFDWARAIKIAQVMGQMGKNSQKNKAHEIPASTPPRGSAGGGGRYKSDFREYMLPLSSVYGSKA